MTTDIDVAPPEALGPASVTWRYFGDWRGLFQGLWAGSMQNMHPKLGAAVEEHSDFFTERWQRLFRSLYPIGGVVFDGERARETAREIRGYHRDIKGIDGRGRSYHALDPDVFYWAHATFFVGTIRTAEHFCGGITEDEKRALFDEHKIWYRQYGMSMRPVPDTWEDFQVYWDHMCRAVLEDNTATRWVLDLSGMPLPPFAPWIPGPVWRVLLAPISRGFVWLTVGLYDQPVRELLGYSWSARDARLHRWVGQAINLGFHLLPTRRRMHPRTRDAYDRAAGRLAADAPLIHTPVHNLPPPAQRDNPMHYCPVHADRRA